MSAGSALLETPLSHFEFAVAGTGSHHRYRGRMESSSATTSSSSAFSDEDLIASLAGFAVEGQTERDLATIKSMLLSQQQQHHQPSQQQQFTHNSYSSSNGGMWPMQSPAGNFPPSLSAWSAANAAAWNPASGQPPPNTPTLSKSLELYGSSGGNYNNDYFPYGSGSRRRDVSLERPHLLHSSTSRSSSRHARSASVTSSTAGGTGGEEMSTPGSSLSTAFDMDMEEDVAPPPTAGPSQYQRFQMQQQQAGDGAAIAMNTGMEDIQEDSMRESMEDESCTSSSSQHPNHPHSSSSFSPSSASPIKGSNGKSIFDNRNAGVAESPHNSRGDANQQWRSSNTSTPTLFNNNASSNGHNGTTSSSTSRPHSRNGSATPTSPPQTRSRSRQQQAQAQAGLRFTSH